MNAVSLRLALAVGLLAATVVACSSSAGDGEDTGQGSSALKCRTCGTDPGDDPPPPPPHPNLPSFPITPPSPPSPPVQGPTIDCTGPDLQVIEGECYHVHPGGHCDPPPPPGVNCGGGYTVVGHYYCPVAYPVQHCNAYGSCTCWTY
jgi:hypothetical protein